MSGTLRFRQLLLVSRLQYRSILPRPQSSPAARPDAFRNALSRYLSAQTAPAVKDALPRDAGKQDREKNRRNLQSSFGNVRSLEERIKRPNAPQQGTELERALAKMDVDVKRSGRVAFQDLSSVLKEIKELPKIPSQAALLLIRCCGSLLSELKPVDRIKMAEELWAALEKTCERLDISHYNALLKVHLENGNKFDPTVFLATMEQKGSHPNRVTYQRMAAYYCQRGDIDGATKILEFMRAKDLPINESVFNVLIQGYARSNDMTSAEGVLEMMRSSQLEPSSDTYRTLVEAYAEKGDMDKIRKALEDATKHGVQLSDSDLFAVIQAMAVKGTPEQITEIIGHLKKSPGFFHDALNASLRLLDINQPNIGYSILASLNLPREINERSGFGVIFLRKLLRYDEPIDKIWGYIEDMRAKQLNPWALERCLESAFIVGKMESAKELLNKMAHSGIPVRSHYFWPIFAVYGKEGDTKKIFDLVGTMTELNVQITLDTLTDYVLPGLKTLSTNEIAEQFKLRYPSVSIMNPLVVFLLDNGNVKDAAKLVQDNPIQINSSVTLRPLAEAYVKSKDYPSTEAILRHLQKQETMQGNSYDIAGQFLLWATQLVKEDEAELTDLMKKMVKSGLKVSLGAANNLDSRFQGRVPPQVAALLDTLISQNRSLQFEDDEFGKHPRNMNAEELETHLKELKSKNMNTRGVLRRLIVEHSRLRNRDRVEEIKAELDASGFEYSGAMYAQMMEMYTQLGDLDKALEVQMKAQQLDNSFITDAYKVLNLATLMITKDKLNDAITLLDDYVKKLGRPLDYELLERNVFRVLNALAEKGDTVGMAKMWEKLNTLGNLVPSNMICGPLVKIHIVKNDIPNAVKAYLDAVEKYKQTPWKGELMRRLVEMEDTTSLQAVMDNSIKLHGETNSLYDLAFAFIDAGRTKQAQKIFDTPGLRARQDRLDKYADRLIERNAVEQMENLIKATRDVFDLDRDVLYLHLIRLYGKLGKPDEALSAWINMQEENLQASPQTLKALATILTEHKREVPFAVPEEVMAQPHETPDNPEEIKMLNSIREDNLDAALEQKNTMDATNQPISVKAYSYLIEILLQKERVKEAINLTRELVSQGNHPYPAVSRFLINKLNRVGDTSTLEELRGLFSDKFNQFLSMDKHVFMSYVNANRSEEVLSIYESDPQLRIPVGGLLHLLRMAPNLQQRVEKLVEYSAMNGDTRGAVAYWTHLFGERKFDESKRLLEKYPAIGSRLRAFNICEKALENNDSELLRKLIEALREHSRPSVALAYSYLIGLNCHNRDYPNALKVLKEATDIAGLGLHEMRLSALRVLEKGLQQMGQSVPFRVPEVQRYPQQEQNSNEFDEDAISGRMSRRRE